MDNSIFEVVHEGVKDLQQAGLVNELTLRKFDRLCLPSIKVFNADQIKKYEKKLKQARQYLQPT